MALLSINNLTVRYPTRFGEFTAIENVDLTLDKGEIHGLVGESGAGKSTIGAVVMGLLESPGYVTSDSSVSLLGEELTTLDDDEFHKRRGSQLGMIFQDPQTSLNPLFTIADQLISTIQQHADINHSDARRQAIELLSEVGIDDAQSRIDEYPHQFSGGMRQRVVIALVLCTNPELIVADEPTTALDVSIQKRILVLLKNLAKQRGVGILLITHDIGVIAEVCNRVTVLRGGKVMESGNTQDVIGNPQNDYTIGLMAAVPLLGKRLDRFQNIVVDDLEPDAKSEWRVTEASAAFAEQWLHEKYGLMRENAHPSEEIAHPILKVDNLEVRYPPANPGWFFKKPGYLALSDISFELHKGEVLGIVGESGSGKSTLAKAIVGLVDYTEGSIASQGVVLPKGSRRSRQDPARRRLQMIFQDPYSSLNNRRTIEQILSEPLKFYSLVDSKQDRRKLVASMLELVEMSQHSLRRYPHQFSGGQRQRIAIARSLLALPDLLICDEPTSALDVSIQAQVLNMLKDLQDEFNMAILFISHNLAVVRQMADRVVVLKSGVMVEQGRSEEFFARPKAEYSKLLLSETPSLAILN
ncbi:MAG: ABC transporter ATP-binding protein [Gammaproteobacteria bacterium]|nr:ABC transporter ATP-binding protein [Gammaproteobacteria bacterium]